MRKHTFNLEPLFEYRQRLEEMSRKEFGEALDKLNAEERKIERLKGLWSRSCIEIDGLKETGAGAGEMDLYHSYMEGLKRHIAGQERILAEVSAAVENKRNELIEASRSRKVIELMKEKSLNSYNSRVSREEQKEADELSSSMFGRNDGDEK